MSFPKVSLASPSIFIRRVPSSPQERTNESSLSHPEAPSSTRTHTNMKSLSPVLASLANAFKIPLRPAAAAAVQPASKLIGRTCNEAAGALKTSGQVAARPFSSTSAMAKKGGQKTDSRVSKLSLILFFFFLSSRFVGRR